MFVEDERNEKIQAPLGATLNPCDSSTGRSYGAEAVVAIHSIKSTLLWS